MRGIARATLFLLLALAMSLPTGAQKQGKAKEQKKDQPAKSEHKADQKPEQKKSGEAQTEPQAKPLFGGTLGLKSSQQKQDTTSMGFNGVDPNGQVEKKFMDSSATAADTVKLAQLSAIRVSKTELDEFLKEGKLKKGGKR